LLLAAFFIKSLVKLFNVVKNVFVHNYRSFRRPNDRLFIKYLYVTGYF